MLKLYTFPVAPNPTRVMLYLAEKAAAGGPIEIEEVRVDMRASAQREKAHLARNPLGTLPVLGLEDGSFLTESLVIIEYLEEMNPLPSLIGSNPLERARTRELERIAESGVLVPIARLVHATNSPLGWPAVPEVAQDARRSLVPPLELLDRLLADRRPFVAGERPTIADCTLAAAFQFGRFGGLQIESSYENIGRWDRTYRARSAVQQVLRV